MSKNAPRVPMILLLTLGVLIIGIFLSIRMSESTDKGTFKKVQDIHQQEKDLYEITPGSGN